MTKTSYVPELYTNTATLEEKTGLPQDYNSLFAAYRELVKASAGRLRIPIPDQEDAAQEVQIKFWLKDGLNLFDPTMGTKFTTFYRRWTTLFSLQERDKSIKNAARYEVCDPEILRSEESSTIPLQMDTFEDAYVSSEFITQWLERAETLLAKSKHADLIPLLRLCAKAAEANTAPSRAEIAEVTGHTISNATNTMRRLRRVLSELGMGMETLYG